MSISDEDVRNAYRFILGREPENEDVVRGHRRSYASLSDLRKDFLRSPEFKAQGFGAEGPFAALAPPPEIDIEADPEVVRAMVERTAVFWAKVGSAEPYWSMGAGEQFLQSHWNAHRAEFYASGAEDRDLVVSLLRRIGRRPSDVGRLVEYGCGVGRAAIPLARAFASVVGLDISPTHLELARRYAEAEGVENITFSLTTATDLMPASGYDLWYSRAVLPHNPPPVIAAILAKAFERLETRGVAIILIPTFIEGYAFHLDAYMRETIRAAPELDGWLARGLDDGGAAGQVVRLAERHAMPLPAVLRIARERNCWLVDSHEERGHREEILHYLTFEKA